MPDRLSVTRRAAGEPPGIASMLAGWFMLKSFAEGTKLEGTASTCSAPKTTGSANKNTGSASNTTGRPCIRSAGTGAHRAVADAGIAVAAYLLAWAWLGTAALTDPAHWCLALVAGAAVIVRAAGSVLGRNPRFSTPADRVTLGRAVVVACCAALTAGGLFAGAGVSGLVVPLGTAAFLLDAADGRVARLTGWATAEGSRLDSDTDAALVLVLSCAAAGVFGPWPLGIGLMYYAFLAAAWFRPSLKSPLPSSTLRKLIGAIQPAALLTALLPGVPAGPGAVLLCLSLGLLVYSFGRDVVELERLRGTVPAAAVPAAAAASGEESAELRRLAGRGPGRTRG